MEGVNLKILLFGPKNCFQASPLSHLTGRFERASCGRKAHLSCGSCAGWFCWFTLVILPPPRFDWCAPSPIELPCSTTATNTRTLRCGVASSCQVVWIKEKSLLSSSSSRAARGTERFAAPSRPTRPVPPPRPAPSRRAPPRSAPPPPRPACRHDLLCSGPLIEVRERSLLGRES